MSKVLDLLGKVTGIIKIVMLIIIAHFLVLHRESDTVVLIFGLIMVALLVLYEYVIKKIGSRRLFTCGIGTFFAISFSVMLLLLDKFDDVILIYYFFLLDDIYELEGEKRRNSLLWFHFGGFLLFCFLDEVSLSHEAIINITTAVIIYGFIFLIYFIIHKYKIERDNYRSMYKELLELSFQQRDILISSDRKKISQELHDSLGHLLMAATMNLRFVKKVISDDNEDVIDGLDEIERILQSSTTELRNCVKNVRELESEINLKAEIQRTSEQLSKLNMVTINYIEDIDESKIRNHVKKAIYSIMREGITNAIIHGKAELITMRLYEEDHNIKLIITDNGGGCEEILKSYGLNGMVESVKCLSGFIYFTSVKEKGFEIIASIPEEVAYD